MNNNLIKTPYGTAHFLEHKMFEQKDGVDPFTFYSERGCDANANTSNLKTTYLFSGANSFEENLNYLLDYVQSPYFTDENVEKDTLAGLKSAEGYIRRELARRINLRNTPEIRFIVDQSIAYGVRMSRLIDEVNGNIHRDEEDADKESLEDFEEEYAEETEE